MKTKFLLHCVCLLSLVTESRAADSTGAVTLPPRIRGYGVQPPARTFTNLPSMHEAYFADFATKPGFGVSRIPTLPPQDFLTLNGETYHFTTPDLIGLENEPAAYHRRDGEIVSVDLLSKKALRGLMQRRELSQAETEAVAQLRSGREYVTTTQTLWVDGQVGAGHLPVLLVVGALKARANCAGCHGVKEGTLLGAFSYKLIPQKLAAPPVIADKFSVETRLRNGVQVSLAPTSGAASSHVTYELPKISLQTKVPTVFPAQPTAAPAPAFPATIADLTAHRAQPPTPSLDSSGTGGQQ